MEIFFNIETKLRVEVTLGWVFLPVLLVNKVPLLVFLAIESPHKDVSVLFVFSI
jgi:hypothetical protein